MFQVLQGMRAILTRSYTLPAASPRPSSSFTCAMQADEAMTKLVPDIKGADAMAAALLVECRGRDEADLQVGVRACACMCMCARV